MTAYHRLTADDLTALASGPGAAATVRELCAGQVSRHLLLLKHAADAWPLDRALLDAAIGALAETQRRDPPGYAALLGDPLVGAWLARLTRAIRRGAAAPGDFLHLGNAAAAAAARHGLRATVTGYARRGRVTLPGLGEAVLPSGADGPVTIEAADGAAVFDGAPAHRWLPLRRLTARHGDLAIALAVEDGNPYRAGYHAPPADRLTDAEHAAWQDLFTRAWELLGRHLAGRAAEMVAGLRAVVPLVDAGDGSARSGTARESVGALGLTPPRSAADFAVTLVHEFQHSKLSAVLDLTALYEPGGAELHFAPWRTDPRPTSGLIQGVYAFLGVADTWRALAAAPSLEDAALRQFSVAREQVRAGLLSLEGSAELTARGRLFTAGMRAALEPLLAEPLPPAAREQGRSQLAQREAAWRARLSASSN